MNTTILNKITDVKETVREWRKQNLKIGLVPTMGALHNGHASLIKKAKETCDRVVVSVFVNPIQFGPNEDFDKYPRTLENDKKVCEEIGADIIFAPTPKEMYGENNKLSNTDLTFVCPPYNIVDCLCGKSRPGHFDGVATVVTKLFNIVTPDYAFFGLKDAQQLFIIKKMVSDLNMNLTIVPCPIVREEDGLALSSRNIYLSKDERIKALTISKSLKYIENLYKKGITESDTLLDSAISILDPAIEVDYIEFRDYDTFEKVKTVKNNTLVAIAAKVGNTRLIDNTIL